MNIVLTDCKTVTADDVDLTVFEKYGNVFYYDVTAPIELEERIRDADVVICNKTYLGKKEIDYAPHLKLIALFATGYNNIDVKYAAEKGICVSNAGSYSTMAVAQQVFAFILGHASKVAEYSADVHAGAWIQSKLFSAFSRPTTEIYGKTLGIFGYGTIGRQVAVIAKAFGMNVIACRRSEITDEGIKKVDFDTLLKESDYLSVHCPLTDETKGVFDKEAFSKMKDGAYFINTARGGVLVEEDLKNALESGKLSGAAADVLTFEPMREDCVLKDAPNMVFTPHVAWAPIETRKRLIGIVCENIEAFLAGNPIRKVN